LPSFLCLPPLMWAVFRFGPRETATVTLLVAGIALAGTAAGLGPFSGMAPNDSLLSLQTFMAVVATFALASAATVNERRLADATRADRLRLEELARARAEDLNRARDHFLATVSHELRTPLNSMLAWVGLARSDESDIAVLRSAIDVFERNIRQHIRLIEDLLDISHMNAGEFHLESREVDLRAVVGAAADSMAATAQARDLKLEFWGTAARVMGDPDRLQQIVANLLSNAVKFTHAGGRITVELVVEGDAAVITVSDSGPGIDPAFVPHLFEPFRQASAPQTRRHGGLGLGLSIVKHLVEAHGGKVSAGAAGSGTGAQFQVRLPRLR
jgi:signal transduction histidine kinase